MKLSKIGTPIHLSQHLMCWPMLLIICAFRTGVFWQGLELILHTYLAPEGATLPLSSLFWWNRDFLDLLCVLVLERKHIFSDLFVLVRWQQGFSLPCCWPVLRRIFSGLVVLVRGNRDFLNYPCYWIVLKRNFPDCLFWWETTGVFSTSLAVSLFWNDFLR